MTDYRDLRERIDEAVIGLAEPGDADAIERMAAEDPGVAVMLERTRARFAELDKTALPEELPADMWARVSEKLDRGVNDEHADDKVVPMSRPRSSQPGSSQPKSSQPKSSRPLIWTASASIAASLVMAVLLGWSLLSKPEPTVIAVLLNDAGSPVALVEGAKDNTTLITLLGTASVPDGRVMQVWTKPEDDGPPVSLGVLERPKGATLTVRGLPVPSAQQLYEITFEQDGGSPTGLPTGPIYGKGLAQQPL